MIWIRDKSTIVPANDASDIGCLGRDRQDGAAGCEDPIEFARNHDALQAATNCDDVQITRRHYIGHFGCGAKWQKAYSGVGCCPMTHPAFGDTTAHEDHSNWLAVEEIKSLQEHIPCAVETQVAGVQDHKAEASSY